MKSVLLLTRRVLQKSVSRVIMVLKSPQRITQEVTQNSHLTLEVYSGGLLRRVPEALKLIKLIRRFLQNSLRRVFKGFIRSGGLPRRVPKDF